VLAYEAGRDGFWLARWLKVRGIEVYVIHSASVAVSRERKRAKTDRLDAAMLMRVFLGWLRGERGHCGMVVIPTLADEDGKRPSRERESLVGERTRIINRMKAALAQNQEGAAACRIAADARRRARPTEHASRAPA
jgi:transposase